MRSLSKTLDVFSRRRFVRLAEQGEEEVDFVVLRDRVPIALFKCKLSDQKIARPLIEPSKALGDVPTAIKLRTL